MAGHMRQLEMCTDCMKNVKWSGSRFATEEHESRCRSFVDREEAALLWLAGGDYEASVRQRVLASEGCRHHFAHSDRPRRTDQERELGQKVIR